MAKKMPQFNGVCDLHAINLSVQLLSNLLSDAPESLTSAPKTGKVHADIHAVSPELNTYAAYETVTTKKIPFMIFLFNMNESEEGNEMRYDDFGRIPPEQEDHARLFLIVRPLTLLNPLYGVWGAMEPKTNVSSESHRKGAFRSPAHPPGITL